MNENEKQRLREKHYKLPSSSFSADDSPSKVRKQRSKQFYDYEADENGKVRISMIPGSYRNLMKAKKDID